ncbi:MAG: hypothetical protein DIU78_001655 [Pseudomonadota bacterium]|nr:MAG: hypothetical protein DIU78_23205 [Pseudomonadota bacterium]
MSVLCVLGLSACATRQAFLPAEHVTGMTPHGYLAAEYEIEDRNGNLGEAKVWSHGAYRTEVRGDPNTVVHVGFALENSTPAPLRLVPEQLYLDSATLDGSVIGPLRPVEIRGNPSVPAGRDAQVEAIFVMPEGVSPNDVRAFRVAWTIANGESRYIQRTPFLQAVRERVPRYYYSPYYDPFVYDPFVPHGGVIIHGSPFYHRFPAAPRPVP